jgi:H+/gluconate symporter-like permease
MLGKLLAESGGADRLAEVVLDRARARDGCRPSRWCWC